ncbi:hypothetical protein H257_12169 [Aphanomyces astaci]|nr:hypothetical protein H257_12169 [Aphanomyces astaci]ETV72807.1 hypothetical protein H257_12169 [Aphanomyces astaci]|eukprot:XP_009837593.1 hypothetical protein H257_12169 [Aphanomyces astaci]
MLTDAMAADSHRKLEVIRHMAHNEVYIVLDYKMKLDPMYPRETTIQHYGKRGISWHGACVIYKDSQSTHNMRYMDHLIHNDNRQDPGSVLALMELILLQVKTEFPTTAMASFQSDNASTYQNQFLPLYLKDISIGLTAS